MHAKLISQKEFGFIKRIWLKYSSGIVQLIEYQKQYDLINKILREKETNSYLGDFPYLISKLEFYAYRTENKKQSGVCQRLLNDLKESENTLRVKHKKPVEYDEFMRIRYGVLHYFIQRGKAADRILRSR